MNKKILIAIPIFCVVLFGCGPTGDPAMDTFAQCLNDQGAKLYVSATCPHCHTQREMFGSAETALNLIDCSIDYQTCQDQEISSAPTWIFSDGTQRSGVQSFSSLAALSGCTAPESVPTAGSNQPL